MKRMFLFFMLAVLCFSGFLEAQTFNEGQSHYKKGCIAEAMGDFQTARKLWSDAFQIFKALNSGQNARVLIMHYLLSQKLNRAFSHHHQMNWYVKKDHQSFVQLKALKFYGNDKTLLLQKLNEIAVKNKKQAQTFLAEAKNHGNMEEYTDALDKLSQAEKLWGLAEIAPLRVKFNRLLKEKRNETTRTKIADLVRQQQFQRAKDFLDQERGSLPVNEVATLETELKDKWVDFLYKEAVKAFKKDNLYFALDKCNEADKIKLSSKTRRLRKRIHKKLNRVKKDKFWVLFADSGINGNFRLNMLDFHYQGNSNQWATVTDSGSIQATPPNDTKNTISLGLMRKFSHSLGLMISVSFIKQQLKVKTDYQYDLVWNDGVSYSATGTMSEDGNIALTPLSINLLYSIWLNKKISLNLVLGPTLFLTKIDLFTSIGYGGAWPVSNENTIYGEWFPFKYKSKKSGAFFGANASAELEYKINSYYSVYLGIQSIALFKQNFNIQLIDQSYYGELWDRFWLNNPTQQDNLPNYRLGLELYNYRINAGFKVYL